MNNPKVSILVVTYNHQHFVADALNSILGCGYDNIEIVVSDDASTDNTPEILKDFAQRYTDKIKLLLSKENQGITKNCNKALSECTGEYICTFAGDDIFLPNKIRVQVDAFIRDPDLVLTYHSVEVFDSDSGKTMYVTYQNQKNDITTFQDLIRQGGLLGVCSVMVRAIAIPNTGFDERVPIASDWLFALEVALKGKIAKVPGIYARYRKHDAGMSKKYYEVLQDALRALDFLTEKYPNVDFGNACNEGKARATVGVSFSLLRTDTETAYILAKQAVKYNPQNKFYRIYFFVCMTVRKSELLRCLFLPVLFKLKYFIRERVS